MFRQARACQRRKGIPRLGVSGICRYFSCMPKVQRQKFPVITQWRLCRVEAAVSINISSALSTGLFTNPRAPHGVVHPLTPKLIVEIRSAFPRRPWLWRNRPSTGDRPPVGACRSGPAGPGRCRQHGQPAKTVSAIPFLRAQGRHKFPRHERRRNGRTLSNRGHIGVPTGWRSGRKNQQKKFPALNGS